MNLLCDLLIVVVLGVSIYLGKKNGMIKTFFGFFGSIIAFVLTAVFARPFGSFLTEKVFYPFFKNRFLDSLSDSTGQSASSLDFLDLPESARKVLSGFGVETEKLTDYVKSIPETVEESVTESVGRFVVMPIAEAVGYACAFLALFIVFSILIRIVVRLLDLVAKLPVLNFANTVLGVVAGAVQGVFFAMVIASLLVVAAPALQGSESELLNSFDPENTFLLRFFAQFDWIRSAILKG